MHFYFMKVYQNDELELYWTWLLLINKQNLHKLLVTNKQNLHLVTMG